MMKGIQIALAILVTSFLPGITGEALAQTPSITASNTSTSCSLPSYALVTSLKHGNLTQKSNGGIPYVSPVYTKSKHTNGAMTGVIGVETAPEQQMTTEIVPPQATTTPPPTTTYTAPPQSAGQLSAEKLFALVNEHRAKVGLPPFQNDGSLAQVAQSRAPELQNEIYGGSYMHAGFQQRNLPYYATENMISQQTEEEALQWWLNSGVHRNAIEGNNTHASVACEGKNCAMIFTSFAPKHTPSTYQ